MPLDPQILILTSLDFSEAALHWRECQPSQTRRCRPSSNARSRGGAPSPSFPTRRRQDHAHGEAAALRRRDRAGRRGARPQGAQARDLRLDGARAGARHLDHRRGARVRARRAADGAARHAGPQGLQRGHLPRADRRRQRRDGDRRGERRRGPDPQAVRGLPAPPPADSHLRQQVRSPGARSARAARRHREHARHLRRAGELAGRQRRAFPRRLRSAAQAPAALRARDAGAVSRPGGRLGPRRSAGPRADRREHLRCTSASRSTSSASPAPPSTSTPIAPGRRRRCSSAAR